MDLTLNQKFEASKAFWTEGFIKRIQDTLDYFKITTTSENVLREIFINSYTLMENIKADIGDSCDPFYDELPFLMYGNGTSIYSEDQLFLLKQKKAQELSNKSILYLPNDKFKSGYISGTEAELKRGESFKRQCLLNNVSVNSAYCKDSNSMWIDKNILIGDAILSILVSRNLPNEYSPAKNGSWDIFFEALGHEFGHYLFKSEFESISTGDFVNHGQSKAHQLGEKYAKLKSNDVKYINDFFSLLVQK